MSLSPLAVITGGLSGIGKETALAFLQLKYRVVVLDVPETSNEYLPSEISYYSCDVSQEDRVKDVFEQVESRFGIPDILVANAGILGPRKAVENYPTDDFNLVIDVNIKGVWYCMKNVLPGMKARKSGKIITTASVAGHVGMAGHIAYSASKHAVLGMTKTLALEVAKYGIQVNAVCPGFTETAMLDSAEVDENYKKGLLFATPMKRFGHPAEIASAIVFLASDASSFMTGQGIILDGGLSIQ